MKFLDRWTARSFGKDSDGSVVFFPRSKKGTSYLVRTEAERTKIEAGLKTQYARFLIFILVAAVVAQFDYFHTLAGFSRFMQTVFLVGAAGIWSHQNFLKEVTEGMPVAYQNPVRKDYRPQILGVIALLVLVAFVIIMSSRLPQQKLPESVASPVAVPAESSSH